MDFKKVSCSPEILDSIATVIQAHASGVLNSSKPKTRLDKRLDSPRTPYVTQENVILKKKAKFGNKSVKEKLPSGLKSKKLLNKEYSNQQSVQTTTATNLHANKVKGSDSKSVSNKIKPISSEKSTENLKKADGLSKKLPRTETAKNVKQKKKHDTISQRQSDTKNISSKKHTKPVVSENSFEHNMFKKQVVTAKANKKKRKEKPELDYNRKVGKKIEPIVKNTSDSQVTAIEDQNSKSKTKGNFIVSKIIDCNTDQYGLSTTTNAPDKTSGGNINTKTSDKKIASVKKVNSHSVASDKKVNRVNDILHASDKKGNVGNIIEQASDAKVFRDTFEKGNINRKRLSDSGSVVSDDNIQQGRISLRNLKNHFRKSDCRHGSYRESAYSVGNTLAKVFLEEIGKRNIKIDDIKIWESDSDEESELIKSSENDDENARKSIRTLKSITFSQNSLDRDREESIISKDKGRTSIRHLSLKDTNFSIGGILAKVFLEEIAKGNINIGEFYIVPSDSNEETKHRETCDSLNKTEIIPPNGTDYSEKDTSRTINCLEKLVSDVEARTALRKSESGLKSVGSSRSTHFTLFEKEVKCTVGGEIVKGFVEELEKSNIQIEQH